MKPTRIFKRKLYDVMHKSLDEFCVKFSSRISRPTMLYTKDFRKDSDTLYLPVYTACLL